MTNLIDSSNEERYSFMAKHGILAKSFRGQAILSLTRGQFDLLQRTLGDEDRLIDVDPFDGFCINHGDAGNQGIDYYWTEI